MLCGNTGEDRMKELEDLYDGKNVSFNSNCPKVARTFYNPPLQLTRDEINLTKERRFINAGCLMTTAIFLTVSALVGILSTVLAVWNTGGNPVERIFNIFGLYLLNTVAAVCLLVAIVVWGIQFQMTIIDNICILNTIVGDMENYGATALGFSYWILIPSLFLYFVSIFILYLRQYLIEREPLVRVNIEDNEDAGAIIIY